MSWPILLFRKFVWTFENSPLQSILLHITRPYSLLKKIHMSHLSQFENSRLDRRVATLSHNVCVEYIFCADFPTAILSSKSRNLRKKKQSVTSAMSPLEIASTRPHFRSIKLTILTSSRLAVPWKIIEISTQLTNLLTRVQLCSSIYDYSQFLWEEQTWFFVNHERRRTV